MSSTPDHTDLYHRLYSIIQAFLKLGFPDDDLAIGSDANGQPQNLLRIDGRLFVMGHEDYKINSNDRSWQKGWETFVVIKLASMSGEEKEKIYRKQITSDFMVALLAILKAAQIHVPGRPN